MPNTPTGSFDEQKQQDPSLNPSNVRVTPSTPDRTSNSYKTPVKRNGRNDYDPAASRENNIILAIQEATRDAIIAGNETALKFFLGANDIDLTDATACQTFSSHESPKQLLDNAETCADWDSQATDLQLTERFSNLHYQVRQSDLGEAKQLTQHLKAIITFTRSYDVVDAAKVIEFVQAKIVEIKTQLRTNKVNLLKEFIETLEQVLAVNTGLTIEKTRLFINEINDQGIFKLWIDSADKHLEGHLQQTLETLNSFNDINEANELLLALETWQQQCQVNLDRSHEDIERCGQTLNYFSTEIYQKKDNILIALIKREALYNQLKDQATPESQRVSSSIALFLTQEEDVRLSLLSARIPVDTVVTHHEKQETLLTLAIQNEQLACADILLSLGADPFFCDSQQQSAIALACKKTDGKFLKLILDRRLSSANSTPAISAEMTAIEATLLKYTKAYSARLNMNGCARSFWGYASNMQNRGEELAKYWDYFHLAKLNNDPRIITSIISENARSAKRGCTGSSQLHQGLLKAAGQTTKMTVTTSLPMLAGPDDSLMQCDRDYKRAKNTTGMNAWFRQALATYDLALDKNSAVTDLKSWHQSASSVKKNMPNGSLTREALTTQKSEDSTRPESFMSPVDSRLVVMSSSGKGFGFEAYKAKVSRIIENCFSNITNIRKRIDFSATEVH